MLGLGRVVAAALSGVLLAQSYSLAPFWPLAWIAPIPLLIAIIGASRVGGFLYGALAGALSMASMAPYLAELAGPPAVATIMLAKALLWAGMASAVRAGARHLPDWAAVFVFPALMAGLETLIGALSPHGSAGAFAYSQTNFLPAIQVASLGGAPAISFVVMLFASAVAFLFARRAFAAAILPALVVASALTFGVQRISHLAATASPTSASPIVIAATLLAGDQFEGVPDDWRSVWTAYAAQIERAADDDRRIVLLPEKIAHLGAGDRGAALEQLAEIARRRDLLLVAGIDDQADEGRFNRAYVFAANDMHSYDKRHMIPGLESHFTRGRADLVVERDGVRFGVAICKDMDFPALGRRYAGVDVMLVPAWDFDEDAWLHSRMAMLRGVENGYAVVRSARQGLLTVSDAYGRVSAQTPSGPQIAFDVSVPHAAPGPTLYSSIGDTFGWTMLALGALLAGWTVVARGRAGQGSWNAH
jgi:apolipoprotein N-acyltransferase